MDAQTSLSSLAIPHLDLVLDEAFQVPPPALFPEVPRPMTVGELAARTGRTIEQVRKRLMDIGKLAAGVEITPEDLRDLLALPERSGIVLLDVREEWEYGICHLPGSVLMTHASFQVLKPKLAEAPLVVAVCHHGVRSFSAALFLREQGVASARSLAGGLDLWAQVIDPSMGRY